MWVCISPNDLKTHSDKFCGANMDFSASAGFVLAQWISHGSPFLADRSRIYASRSLKLASGSICTGRHTLWQMNLAKMCDIFIIYHPIIFCKFIIKWKAYLRLQIIIQSKFEFYALCIQTIVIDKIKHCANICHKWK